jgi:hypothetical protein
MKQSSIRVAGLDNALEMLRKQPTAVSHRTLTGLVAAGLTVQRISQQLVPVDTGNLKASAFTLWRTMGENENAPAFRGEDAAEAGARHQRVVQQEKATLPVDYVKKPEVEVGYSVAYAIMVHENLEARHPGGGTAKFLEVAFARMANVVMQALKTGLIKRTKRDDMRTVARDYVLGLAGKVSHESSL